LGGNKIREVVEIWTREKRSTERKIKIISSGKKAQAVKPRYATGEDAWKLRGRKKECDGIAPQLETLKRKQGRKKKEN